jgi:hypothetical protein
MADKVLPLLGRIDHDSDICRFNWLDLDGWRCNG